VRRHLERVKFEFGSTKRAEKKSDLGEKDKIQRSSRFKENKHQSIEILVLKSR
jgi:hypothetical protein